MYARKVIISGNKEEEDMGISGDQLHSHDPLDPMESAYPLEPLYLLQIFFVELSTSSR